MRTFEKHIIIVDEKGKVLWFDTASRDRFPELGTEEPNMLKMFASSNRPQIERAIVAVIDGGKEESMKAKMVSSSGTETEVTIELVPLVGEEEICTVTINHPLAETAPAFQDLHEFVQTMDRAMDKVRTPIISADRFGRVLMLNQYAEEQTGFSTREVLGRDLISLFNVEGESLDNLDRILNEVLRGQVRNLSVPLRTKGGKEVQGSWRFTYAELGDEGEGVLMAFSYDPSSLVASAGPHGEVDENLLLLVTGSSHLIGTHGGLSVDEEIERLIEAQSLHFGILRIEGLETGPVTYSAGVKRGLVDEVLASPALNLEELSSVDSPSVVELDPWAYRGRMPQDVSSVLYIPLGSRGVIRGFALFGTEGSVRRWASRTPMLQIFSNQTIASLRNAEMITTLTRRTMEIQSIYEISQILSSTLDFDALLDQVVDKGLNLANGVRCSIYRRDESSGDLELLKDHAKEGASDIVDRLLETRISEMIESGKSEIFDSLSDIPDEGRHSFMVLPLSAGGESLGAMFLERDESPFEDYDLRLMGHFAATTALALRNASLYERVNGIARELQAYNDLLAHDIANYNVPIHGYLEMLMSEPHLNEKQNEYVTKALRQSENITSMVTNVRKLAEIRLRDTMDLESMDLVRSMVKVVKRMSSSPFCHGSIIRFERHPDTAYGLASDGIEDIFVNLLTNACQYGEGGDIDIGISMHSEDGTDFWKIDFQDHGIGVPDEWKERIFSRFWENDSDRRAEAKGLGLSVVRALCIQYGGDVWVSDRVEGDPSQGSVFSVTIPAVDGP